MNHRYNGDGEKECFCLGWAGAQLSDGEQNLILV